MRKQCRSPNVISFVPTGSVTKPGKWLLCKQERPLDYEDKPKKQWNIQSILP